MLSVQVATDKTQLLHDFQAAFDGFMEIIQPIYREDLCLQHPLHPETSSTKWHLGHALGWYWERFVLSKFTQGGYRAYDEYIFNLYNHGSHHQTSDLLWFKNQNGGLLRPRVEEIKKYAGEVRRRVIDLIDCTWEQRWQEVASRVILGIQHLQQHQEQMLADLLFVLSHDSIPTAYPHLQRFCVPSQPTQANHMINCNIKKGIYSVSSYAPGAPFFDSDLCCLDNKPCYHEIIIEDCQVAQYFVTNRQYKKFIDAGGYAESQFWSTKGWDFVYRHRITAPLYWQADSKGENWLLRSFNGIEPIDPQQPVCHVSYYEACAYVNWFKTTSAITSSRSRLPTEAELEVAAEQLSNFNGHVLQWTSSPYVWYPNNAEQGQLSRSEEHSKRIALSSAYGSVVLRGSSIATPQPKPSRTLRTYTSPGNRTQFAGIRLAFDC